MESSKNQPCNPRCKNASASKKPKTIKQYIILPHHGSSSSPPTNSSASNQCAYVSSYIQPACIPVSTTITNCNTNQIAPGASQDHKKTEKVSTENINLLQTVDIVVKPKNSQLVHVDVIPSSSQVDDDHRMIIPIQLQFCPHTCPRGQKLSTEVTVLHETSKCGETVRSANICHDACPQNKNKTSEMTDANKSYTEASKDSKTSRLTNCVDICPKRKQLVSEVQEQTENINKNSKFCKVKPINICLETCPKNKNSSSEALDQEENIRQTTKHTERQPTRYCFDSCTEKHEPVETINDNNNQASKGVETNTLKGCSRGTCPKKSKFVQTQTNTAPECINLKLKAVCPDTCPKKQKSAEVTSETPPEAPARPPNEPLKIVKPPHRTHLLYKVCKPELEQYIEYAEPCEETASETSIESIPISIEIIEEDVRPTPWYEVLYDGQFQEPYVCDSCAVQESVEVQTELVLGENLFSQSLDSVTDAEKNNLENRSNHTLEIDTFFLPPTGTVEIYPMQKKSDLPDIDRIVAINIEADANQEIEKPKDSTDKKQIPLQKKKCSSYSPCCVKSPEEEEEDDEEVHETPLPPLPPKKIDFVFATNCNEHEPYYKLLHLNYPSPDENEEPCETDLEMPWDKILLPENPKIRPTTTLNFGEKMPVSEPAVEENNVPNKPEPPIIEINSSTSEPYICKSKIANQPQLTPVESSKSCTVSKSNSTKFKTKDAAVECGCITSNSKDVQTTITSERFNNVGTVVTQLSLNSVKPTDVKVITCRYVNSNMNSESESKKADAPFANSTCDDRSMPTSKVDCAPCETSATSIDSTTVPLKQDIVYQAFKSCEEELRPLRSTLVELQTKLRKLNMPELNCLFAKNKPVEDVPDRPQTRETTAETQPCSLPAEEISSECQTLPKIPYQHCIQIRPQDYNVSPNNAFICDSVSRPNSGGYNQNRPMSEASRSPQNFQSFPIVSQYSCIGSNPMQQQDRMQQFHPSPMESCNSNNAPSWNTYSRPGTQGNQMPMQYPPAQNYQPYATGNYANQEGTGYYNSRPATAGNQYGQQDFQSMPMGSCSCNGSTNEWQDIPIPYHIPPHKKSSPVYNLDMNNSIHAAWTTIHNCREVPTHDKYKTGPTDSSGSGSDNRCYNYCMQLDQAKNKNHFQKKSPSGCSGPCQRGSNFRRPYSQGAPISQPISIEMQNVYSARMQNFPASHTSPTYYNPQAPPIMPPYSPQYNMQIPPNYNAYMPGHFEVRQSTPYYVDNMIYDNFHPNYNSTLDNGRCVCGRPITSEKPKRRNKGIQKTGTRRTPIKKIRVPHCIKPLSSTTSNESQAKIVKRNCKSKKKCRSGETNAQSSESVCPFIDAIKSILLIDDKKMIKTGPYAYSYDSSFFTKKLKNMRLHLRVRPSRRKAQ